MRSDVQRAKATMTNEGKRCTLIHKQVVHVSPAGYTGGLMVGFLQ